MARAKATTVQQEREIRRCVTQGITAPKQVYRHLEAEGFLAGEDWVCEKTVARRIREFTPRDDSGPWSLTDADVDADEVALILDVLAIRFSPPFTNHWPSKELVRWIARVRTACPDIPAVWALALADAYRYVSGPERRYLDMVLALRPWASDHDLKWFVYAVQCAAARIGPAEILPYILEDLLDSETLAELEKVAERPDRIFRAW